MILNKKLFYEQLKPFAISKLPIYISMPIDIGNKYKINLSENRITSMKINFNTNFTIQIIDTTQPGYKKYVCNDIEFNLLNEGIHSDYQLYEFVNNLLEKYISKE